LLAQGSSGASIQDGRPDACASQPPTRMDWPGQGERARAARRITNTTRDRRWGSNARKGADQSAPVLAAMNPMAGRSFGSGPAGGPLDTPAKPANGRAL
jgi:hypothetical protein